jgi:hypothetical protein
MIHPKVVLGNCRLASPALIIVQEAGRRTFYERGIIRMTRYLLLLVVLMCPGLLSASDCPSGYQPATLLKVMHADLPGESSKRVPAPAEPDTSPQPQKKSAVLIFSAGREQYQLRIPANADFDVTTLKAGQPLCWQKEETGTRIRVMTLDGRALPGTAQSMHEMRTTQ